MDDLKNTGPASHPAVHPEQNSGQDHTIAEALEAAPRDADAQLDCGLDESMDASDPPTAAQPGDSGSPMPSSGFDPVLEAAIQQANQEQDER